jgi:hypothetical protein
LRRGLESRRSANGRTVPRRGRSSMPLRRRETACRAYQDLIDPAP